MVPREGENLPIRRNLKIKPVVVTFSSFLRLVNCIHLNVLPIFQHGMTVFSSPIFIWSNEKENRCGVVSA
jgi:hypothetical protein